MSAPHMQPNHGFDGDIDWATWEADCRASEKSVFEAAFLPEPVGMAKAEQWTRSHTEPKPELTIEQQIFQSAFANYDD